MKDELLTIVSSGGWLDRGAGMLNVSLLEAIEQIWHEDLCLQR